MRRNVGNDKKEERREITSQSVMSRDLSFSTTHSSLERQELTSKIHTRISLMMIGPLTDLADPCLLVSNVRTGG